MLATISKVFGTILLAVGILGFIPAATPDNHLLGIFHVDPLHNLIHLVSGVLAIFAGFKSARASRRYFQVFGVIYGLVAILGFISMDKDILGLVANNMADNWLHVGITVFSLGLGFGYPADDRSDS